MPTPALPDAHRRAAAVLSAAGLTVLDTEDGDTGETGLRVRTSEHSPDHTLVVPVVNGREQFPPPLPQHNERRSTWVGLMQAARNALTAAGWTRLFETPTGGEFTPPN
ncbi:hypothetical protein ABZ864_47670 [Streptomyces sp. NPDC047082]|uniref:hypothetical protein n=1 Tax=Streptomyces sp. NPDC047082 TaxID=3155259 RepID=UPI0033D32032